jgi:DNA-binding NarL/FixJ family response regulator
MKTDPLRVVIADDEKHLRYSFRILIQKEGMVVVGEATHGQEAVELYRQHKPDLLMLDINMPLKNGDEALVEVLKEFPDAKVLMLTMVADAEIIKRCIKAGAIGYILKNNPLDEIQRRLHQTIESLKPSGDDA